MKGTLALTLSVLLLPAASPAFAQLNAAKDGPIVYGHHHLNTANLDAQKKFFVDTIGGTLIKVGTGNTEIVKFPNVLIFFRATQAPTGGTRGTTVNHIGFSVPNLRQMVDKVKAAGFKMITDTEAAGRQVKDDIAAPLQAGGAQIAFALAPDEVKVEFVENTQQSAPITLHHVHFFNPKNAEMRDWYVKTFNAKPREGAAVPGGGSAGHPVELLVVRRSGCRDAGPRARSHRLRGEESRSLLQEAGGRRDQAGRSVSASAGAGHCHCVHHRSLGHLHRADRRPRQDLVMAFSLRARPPARCINVPNPSSRGTD